MNIVLVSGGFDPLHSGHLDYLYGANEYGLVIVALNSDEWLMRKKGYVFMPIEERKRILKSLSVVSDVVTFDDSDDTVCQALSDIQPDFFANGGDRTEANPDEHAMCKRLAIAELFDIGGKKTNSSSQLMRNYDHNKNAL